MKANFLLSDYFNVNDPPPQRNIHIIIHRPLTTGKCLPIFYLSNKGNFAILFSIYCIDHLYLCLRFVLDQGHTDVSRVIANLGYLPRQGTYKLMFFNSSVLFLTFSLL